VDPDGQSAKNPPIKQASLACFGLWVKTYIGSFDEEMVNVMTVTELIQGFALVAPYNIPLLGSIVLLIGVFVFLSAKALEALWATNSVVSGEDTQED